MKKVFVFLIISLVWCACSERNEPSSQQGDNEKEQQEEHSEIKPRYIVETYTKYIWVDETSAYKNLLGSSTRIVYKRDVNPKYKKSYSVYQNDVLQYVISYTNIDDGEYGKYTYCSEGYKDLLGRTDTTYYYDSDRTITRETRNGNNRILYKYDSQERLISQTQYTYNELSLTSEYTYKGLVRYGLSKSYSDSKLHSLITDTCEYTDNRYEIVKRNSTLQKTFDTYQNLVVEMYRRTDSEYGLYGITKSSTNTIFTYSDGSKSTYKTNENIDWLDDLNYTYEAEHYENDKKIYIIQEKCQFIR